MALWVVVVAEPAEGADRTDAKDGAGAGGLEVVGGTEARTAALQICPEDLGGSEPAHTCTKTSDRPYLGGKLTVLIQNNDRDTSKEIEVRYVPRGGTRPVVLPGGSDRIFLVVGGTSPTDFLRSLLRKATGQLTGNLEQRLGQALPLLAQLAVGRFRFAAAVARSPVTAALIAAALRAGGKLAPAQVRTLALRLGRLISPRNRKLELSGPEVRRLLRKLREAVLTSGSGVAKAVMKGVLRAAAKMVSKSALTVEPGKALSLTIGFAPPAGESASSINGTLLISAAGEKPLAVPVNGEARTFEEVTVTPSALTFDSTEDDADLTLEGAELVEYLRSYGGEELPATLHGDDGDAATATLELPLPPANEEGRANDSDIEEGRVNRAKATVTLSGDPGAGKYTGKLTLPGLPADAGSVSVELKESRPLWCMILLVLLGVLAIGVGTRLATTAARRNLLKEVLDQTHHAYVHVRGTPGSARGWDLDDLLAEGTAEEDEEPSCRWKWPWQWQAPWRKNAELSEKLARLQGLPALRKSIATARSSKDLDEDAERVLDMVARMQRWLRVEPLARLLAELDEKRASEAPWSPWERSATARDTGVLRELARREPEDAGKADELVSRMLFQARWHNSLAALWDRAEDDPALASDVGELDKRLGTQSTVGKRTPEEQDVLEELLARVWKHHRKDAERPEFPPIPGAKHLDCGITPVDWESSANLFTGWATLDGPSYGQLARRAATSSRGLYMPSPADLKREVCLIDATDWLWAFAALVLASAAYSATAYSDTWGSCQDLATAFLAGTLGKVTIDWAALPIFQSVRLRKAAKST